MSYRLVLLFLLIIAINPLCAQTQPNQSDHPSFSDQTSPLKLSLTVTPIDGTTDTLTIQCTLTNPTDQPIYISASASTSDLKDYIKQTILLRTDPVTYISTQQTYASSGGEKPAPKSLVLNPGESVSAQWQTGCGCLGPLPDKPQAPCLTEPGRYKVIAHLLLRDSETTEPSHSGLSQLVSDPTVVDFGGVSTAPDPTFAKVNEVYPDQNIATINAGQRQGVQAGETWHVIVTLGDRWDLTITEVGDNSSTVTLDQLYIMGAPPKPLNRGATAWRKDTMRYNCDQ